MSAFGGPVLHSRDFGAEEDNILQSETIRMITIVGGGKSSVDMRYEAVKAEKEVSWIIRDWPAILCDEERKRSLQECVRVRFYQICCFDEPFDFT